MDVHNTGFLDLMSGWTSANTCYTVFTNVLTLWRARGCTNCEVVCSL